MKRLLKAFDDFEDSDLAPIFGGCLLFAVLFAGLIFTGVQ
jgi:hypothetical protein